MRILSLDQATKHTGYSVFDKDHLIESGMIEVNPKEKNEIIRIRSMYDQIRELIKETHPQCVILENVQFQQNFKTYKTLCRLQGCLFSIMFDEDTPFLMCEPSAWRSELGIKGKKRVEQKQAAIDYVAEHYLLEVSDDEAEAICIGAWGTKTINYKES